MTDAYRSPEAPSFEPLLQIHKAPEAPVRRQIRMFRTFAILCGLPSAGAMAFLTIEGNVDSSFILLALPLLLSVFLMSAAARRRRALAEMQIAVSYASLSRMVRFESQSSPPVLVPADDIVEISACEEQRADVETMGAHGATYRHARVAFDILARTSKGDVKLGLPLVATGDSFVAAARDHLREVLRQATERILKRRVTAG